MSGAQAMIEPRVSDVAAATALIVEDDAEIGALIAQYLEANQIRARLVPNGAAMDAALEARNYDLLILDLNLPGENGLSICRRLRGDNGKRIPIVIVTAQSDDVDKIVGLEIGADDYVVKPFNPRELLARIRAVLRRAAWSETADGAAATPQSYRFAGWRVELTTRDVIAPSGLKVAMTGAEFDLLHVLCEHPNRILTRDQLISLTHGPVAGPLERSIDTLISRLRQKMETEPKAPRLIQTVRSEGYLFAAQIARS